MLSWTHSPACMMTRLYLFWVRYQSRRQLSSYMQIFGRVALARPIIVEPFALRAQKEKKTTFQRKP